MAKNKRITSIGCGDWMRNWSGNVGKLRLNELENNFTWTGHWQGRHGQKGTRLSTTFTYNDGRIEVTKDSKNTTLPDSRDVIQAVEIILNSQL